MAQGAATVLKPVMASAPRLPLCTQQRALGAPFAPGFGVWVHRGPDTAETSAQGQLPATADGRAVRRFILQGLFLGWLFRVLTVTAQAELSICRALWLRQGSSHRLCGNSVSVKSVDFFFFNSLPKLFAEEYLSSVLWPK